MKHLSSLLFLGEHLCVFNNITGNINTAAILKMHETLFCSHVHCTIYWKQQLLCFHMLTTPSYLSIHYFISHLQAFSQTEQMSNIVWKTAMLSAFHRSLLSSFAGMESTKSSLIDNAKKNAVLHLLFCSSISAGLLPDLTPPASATLRSHWAQSQLDNNHFFVIHMHSSWAQLILTL